MIRNIHALGKPTTPGRRKRQRLSSPTYDEQCDLSQDQMEVFEAHEQVMASQRNSSSSRSSSQPRPSQVITEHNRRKRDEAIAAALGLKDLKDIDDEKIDKREDRHISPSDDIVSWKENFHPSEIPGSPILGTRNLCPSASCSPKRTPKKQQKHSGFGFASALHIERNNAPSPSPDEVRVEQDQDIDSWFESKELPAGALLGFTSANILASKVGDEDGDGDAGGGDDGNPEQNEDDWFNSKTAPAGAFTGFQSAKALKALDQTFDNHSVSPSQHNHETTIDGVSAEPIPPFVGFTTGKSMFSSAGSSKPILLAPSAEALKKAEERMKQWHEEIDNEFTDDTSSDHQLPDIEVAANGKMVLGAIETSQTSGLAVDIPESPTPAGFGLASKRPLTSFGPASSLAGFIKANSRPFKSPLIAKPSNNAQASTSKNSIYSASPLNPNRSSGFASASTLPLPQAGPTGFTTAASSSSLVTPSRPVRPSTTPSLAFQSPVSVSPQKRSLGITPRRTGFNMLNSVGKSGSKFTTPFKAGFKRPEVGTSKLERLNVTPMAPPPKPPVAPVVVDKGKGKMKEKVVSARADGKRTLENCGRRPQSYTVEQLERMGINISELSQITPQLAPYYCFHSKSSTPFTASQIPSTEKTLGSAAAFEELQSTGCNLATKEWVENHWSLILWKLAGLVYLEPENEKDVDKKRWCWKEVMRQLKYRYDTELNGSSRPALRLITTEDAPAGSTMILCVSNIIYPSTTNSNGSSSSTTTTTTTTSIPQLEVTDGWYRLRAEIDPPLARAIQKGSIRIGRKLAVVGAKLNSEQKEAVEILEAYESVTLKISGNSCHLAPWYSKLGFQREPFVASLRSCTADGGMIAVMDLEVVKAYPVAFIEFIVHPDGRRTKEGPRNEREESIAHNQWMTRRDIEATKLRAEFEAEMHRYEGYAERLDRKAGRFRPPEDDSAPEYIEDLLYELEDPTKANETLRGVSALDAGWLSEGLRDKCKRDREKMSDDLERDLNALCPPRQVRNFRVIEVQDSTISSTYSSNSSSAHLKAQLTVWDALSFNTSAEEDGLLIKEGQRFIVTNLLPTQPGSWRRKSGSGSGGGGGIEILYLMTRRDTKWIRVPSRR
ncbi:Breast cancer type 2 susceptibility protein [Abortiporus biennis]